MNPAVPYTPEEIARDAYECWKAGAAIVHIHVRNADGSPSTKFELISKETWNASAPFQTVTYA